MDNFFLVLAAILLIPVIPAFVIYKFLPASDTDVSGPYQGLSLKLKGAFAGYFLLVIVGLALQYVVMNNEQQKEIETLQRNVSQKDTTINQLQSQLQASANPVIDWHIKGSVTPEKDNTRFFYDDGTTTTRPDGSFDLIKRSIANQGKTSPPGWMCVYNLATGFKVISLNRDISHPDIATYDIAFNDEKHEIIVKKPIPINSMEKDSVVAVANFINERPELKAKVMELDPLFLPKAEEIRKQQLLDKAKILRFQTMRPRVNQ